MRLIKKIEVNYLRSLYGLILDGVGDLNVVFGRNDSGKSNLLRALNLFFNERVESGQYLDFDLDMSDRRKQEARDAKGRQFIWIKIYFNIPQNYRAALGDEIAVKRQWNRDGDMNETIFPDLEGKGKQARLTRFLNDIDFTYIPAIKDLTVYADLIERMYGAAAGTDLLREATVKFVDAIGHHTTSLSSQLSTLFGGPARLAPPTEMSRLFRSLDFAHGEDGHSLLRQKGDGVKARHLPELLRFINASEPRKKFYLWGFEEPENSLDLGAAETEARRFAVFAKRDDTQVFITSHSPAFYLSGSEDNTEIRRYFITKQEKGNDGEMVPKNAAALIDRLEDAEIKMEQAGLLQLPFVIRQMGEQRQALKEKEVEAESLRSELSKLQQPTLFLEGLHDIALFEAAFSRLGIAGSIVVKALGGAPQTTEALLSAVLAKGGVNAASKVLFLFDDDKAGRSAVRKLSKSGTPTEPSICSNNALVWNLQWTEDFKSFTKRHGIDREKAFFTVEFLYPSKEAAALCLELVSQENNEDAKKWEMVINGDYWHDLGQIKCSGLLGADKGSPDWFYARGVPDGLKRKFAEEAGRRGFSTEAIDKIAETVSRHLLVS